MIQRARVTLTIKEIRDYLAAHPSRAAIKMNAWLDELTTPPPPHWCYGQDGGTCGNYAYVETTAEDGPDQGEHVWVCSVHLAWHARRRQKAASR